MMKKHKGTILFLLLSLWALSAANGVKDFYFEMRSKTRGEVISYASLQEFCGWTGEKRPGESDFDYGFRKVRNMFSAIMAMSFLSVLFFGSLFGLIFGIFWLTGAFRDEAQQQSEASKP